MLLVAAQISPVEGLNIQSLVSVIFEQPVTPAVGPNEMAFTPNATLGLKGLADILVESTNRRLAALGICAVVQSKLPQVMSLLMSELMLMGSETDLPQRRIFCVFCNCSPVRIADKLWFIAARCASVRKFNRLGKALADSEPTMTMTISNSIIVKPDRGPDWTLKCISLLYNLARKAFCKLKVKIRLDKLCRQKH